MNYENNDLTEKVGEHYKFKEEFKMITSHSWRTLAGLAILAVIGALQALHGQPNLAVWIDMVVPVLLALEHILEGKTE